MKHPNSTAPEVRIPEHDRRTFTEMLIAGKNLIPWRNRERLIDEPFFYSHEWDVEKALREHFTREWEKRKYAAANAHRRDGRIRRERRRSTG